MEGDIGLPMRWERVAMKLRQIGTEEYVFRSTGYLIVRSHDGNLEPDLDRQSPTLMTATMLRITERSVHVSVPREFVGSSSILSGMMQSRTFIEGKEPVITSV